MSRIVLLIDGENFKGKIRSICQQHAKQKPLWSSYDFKTLIERVFPSGSLERKVFYFASIKKHPASPTKSFQLIEEQRALKTHLERQGFEVILSGRVRGQLTGSELIFREKGVDVKIAVDMVSIARDKSADEIILASSDSDLQPAIQEVKKHGVKLTYLGFETQQNKGIMYTSDRSVLLRCSEVLDSLKNT